MVTSSGKDDFTFTGFNYNNGTFNFRTCENAAAENPADIWLGDIYANDTRRVLSCGGLPGNHCLYFVREHVETPVGECMCREARKDGMVWPATQCGETQTIGCFSGADGGAISRVCSAEGEWSEYISSNCTCAGETLFDTEWPATAAGETAHVACVGDATQTRDRLCQKNGQWDNVMTGGCACSAETYRGVQWSETDGGSMGEHVCSIGSEGSSYRRPCNMDGTWGDMSGGCTCPTVTASGVEWRATVPLQTQEERCAAGSVSESMSRTCGMYGSWDPIVGNCDCPEEELAGMRWPQTASGTMAKVSCVAGAVGTPSTRFCNVLGTWGEVTEGSCACPAADWANYAGTHYQFPETAAGAVVTLPCANGEGEITRACEQYGRWSEPEGCYEPVYCPAEDVGQLHFERTLGGSTAMNMCHGSSMSYGRLCKENGEWESVVGYCLCPAETGLGNIEWPATRSDSQVTLPCGEGFSGERTRECSFFGDWVEVSGECVRNRCPAEESTGFLWPETDSLVAVTVECASGLGEGVSRLCGADGVWADVTGACACPAETIDGVEYERAAAGTVAHKECPAGFVGSFDRLCNGRGEWEELVNNCAPITCPEETFKGALWPATVGGTVATYACPEGDGEGLTRACGENGVWSTRVTGAGCYCPAMEVNEQGNYIFARTAPNKEVKKDCDRLYYGSISARCSLGGTWEALDNQCQRYQCPEDSVGSIRFPKTDSNSTGVVECAAGAEGTGYLRFCNENGVWGDMEGFCRCPAETVEHTDGQTYYFAETEAGKSFSGSCGPSLTGSIARSCSQLGEWGPVRGSCKPLHCPANRLNGYDWPETRSQETARMPCNDEYQKGEVTRLCKADGTWDDPSNTCEDVTCEGMTINRLSNGCMNLRFTPDEATPYVHLSVVPSSNPNMTVVFRGRTARVCGLDVNVAYSLYVHYCADEATTQCTGSCMRTNVYYQQSCDTMRAVDVVEYQPESEQLVVSAKFPACPKEAEALELSYRCVEGCDDDEWHTLTKKCSELVGGCPAGGRRDIALEGAFPANAVFAIRQRMQLETDFSALQPYSPEREFRPRELLRASTVTLGVSYINSQTLRLDLGPVDQGLVLYKKHVVYIYKKQTDSRRLVDSLFSKVVLCPLAAGICEETGTTVVVEPGYSYTFSVYSYPVVTLGKVVVSTDTVHVDPEPVFSLAVEPGDSFMKLAFADAKYPLFGMCRLYARSAGSDARTTVDVTLPAATEVTIFARNLVTDSLYTVICALHDALGLEKTVTRETRTKPAILPELTLKYLNDTTYDVHMSASLNKPGTLYCKVTDAMERVPSDEELLAGAVTLEMSEADKAYEFDLVLPQKYESEFRVTCLAEDEIKRRDKQFVLVTPSHWPFEPTLVATVPKMNEENVPPYVEMQLVFRYPVTVTRCQFCFFILYNTKDRSSVSIYPDNLKIEGNTILFSRRRMDSLTTYQLKPSTRGLIIDVATGVAFDPISDVLISFTTKQYNPASGEVEYPSEGEIFPVNGTIIVAFTNYLYLSRGALALNALTVDAENTCLQLKHPTQFTTSLLIHVPDCVGHLFPDTQYTLVLPEGFLQTHDGIESPELTHSFFTDKVSFAPRVIDAEPAFQTVPVDASITLKFDQPVVFGAGYLFVSEYVESEYVNSFNIPASKASFGSAFPYAVTWDASLFSFKPQHRYVVSWSEDLVRNAQGQSIAASTAEENVEFETDRSACSPDFIAEKITGTFTCTTTEDKCVCRTRNVLAVDY